MKIQFRSILKGIRTVAAALAISVSAAYAEDATLEETEYTVTIGADAGISDVTQSATVKSGDTITISAGEGFLYWEGDVPESANIFDDEFTLTVTADATITAKKASKSIYVAPTAAGNADGSSWDNAFGTIQDALNSVGATEGAVIYIKSGNYPITTTIVNSSDLKGPIVLKGGFSGTGSEVSGESVIYRDPSVTKCKLLTISSCDTALNSLTFSNAYTTLAGVEIYGLAAGFISCPNVAVFDCDFRKNTSDNNTDWVNFYGAGIGLKGGTNLIVEDSTFDGNRISNSGSGTDNPLARGGAIGANTVKYVSIRNSTFNNNSVWTIHARGAGGGAIWMNNQTWAEIVGCTFTTNFARRGGGTAAYAVEAQQGNGHWGGTIGVIGTSGGSDSVSVRDCHFYGGWNNSASTGDIFHGRGGVLYFENTDATVERAIITDAGKADNGGECQTFSSGSIDVRYGTLTLRNVLHANAYAGYCLGNDTAKVTAENCTFVGAKDNSSFFYSSGYIQKGSTASATFKNCIFAGNDDGDYICADGSPEPTFTYCYTEGTYEGAGNIPNATTDVFADTTYYKLASRTGSYKGGYFEGGYFSPDTFTSTLIDAADSPSGALNETQPHGYLMNLGYEGGISVASLSDLSETRPVIDPAELRILSYPVANTSANGGTVKADIASLGGSTTKATITLYYGATATKDNSWRTIALNGTYGEWETASYTITDMTGSPLVYYYFTASSGNLTDTTDMRSFKIATPPAVTYTREAPFYAVLRNTAKLVFNYKDSGGVATAYIRLIDSATNEETQIPINYGNPLVAGDYLVEITGLKAGTTYEATLLATNDAGTTTLDTYTITTRPESGSVFYIAPTAAGLEDGSTPANAASDINAVTTEATYTGDEIRFLKGNYGYDTAINVNSAQGLTIAGGYDQDGKVVGISTITNNWRITSSSHRLLNAASSTLTLRNLHFNGGYYYEVNFSVDGNALLLSSCNTTIENCTFSENALRVTTGYHVYGVVIGAKNGTLAVRDSIFTNNVTESVNFKATGNAIGATSLTKLTIERTTFADNALAPLHNRSTYGGAIALTSCTDATISSCTFTNNINATGKHYASSWSSEGSVGGHLYITGTTLKINDTTFSGGFTIFEGGSLAGNGGAIYATGGSKLIINRSYFLDGGRTTLAGTSTSQRYAYNTGTGSIDASGSSTYVYMTNVLVRGNNRGHIFYNSGATYDIVNCTITGNKADTQLTTLVNSI